jgi:phosphoribosylamine---glycine ligase
LTQKLAVRQAHSLCVVLAAAGYPETPRKGDPISGIAEAESVEGVRVYHAGTRLEQQRVVTAGGRVLGVTAVADSMQQARERAYRAVDAIDFAGKQWRSDIGVSIVP